ncbi:MAG: hypothetical protein U1E65_11685 [Myxococcota bacterium]
MLLDATAQKLYSTLNTQAAFTQEVQAKIETRCGQTGNIPLTAQQLQEVLLQAMPDKAQMIQQGAESCGCASHQCDGKNGKFISTVASVLIEKERNGVYTAPTVQYTPRRDPLTTEIILGKDTDFAVQVNAGVFDAQGKPLAQKVVVRDRADMKLLPEVLKNYYTTWGDKPDIVKVSNDAAYLKLVDEQENEFQFGHGVGLVSFDKAGKEQGRNGKTNPLNKLTTHLFYPKAENGVNVPDLTKPTGQAPQIQQGPQLDTTHVQTFKETVGIKIEVAASDKGMWLDVPVGQTKTTLNIGEGLIREPGTTAQSALWNMVVNSAVPDTDFSFKGSAAGSAALNAAQYNGYQLAHLLNENVRVTSHSNPTNTDNFQEMIPVKGLLYPTADAIKLGGAKFSPLADISADAATMAEKGIHASIEPLAGDPQADGFCVRLGLDKGFINADSPANLSGYSIEAGYRGPDGKWQDAGSVKVTSSSASGAAKFEVALDNATEAVASNRQLEIRVRNAEGLPAGRVLIPFKEMKWGC